MAERSFQLDRLRVLSVVGVAHFHVAQEITFRGVSLPLFLLLAVAIPLRAPQPPLLRPFVLQRARRLLLPFLFWSIVYAPVAASWSRWPGLSLPFAGTWGHLWFLPCLFLIGIASLLFSRRGTKRVAALLAAASLVLAYRTHDLPHPACAYFFALPALFLGWIVARSAARPGALVRCALVGAFLGVGGLLYRDDTVYERYGWAMALLALALLRPGAPDPLTRRLVPSLYGVYLLHPAVDLATFHHFGSWGIWGRTALVLLLSWMIAEAMRSTRLLRPFV